MKIEIDTAKLYTEKNSRVAGMWRNRGLLKKKNCCEFELD